MSTSNKSTRRVIIHPGTHLPTAISAIMSYEAEQLGNEANLGKTGPYHHKVYAAEEHRVQVYHTENSIIARLDVPQVIKEAEKNKNRETDETI